MRLAIVCVLALACGSVLAAASGSQPQPAASAGKTMSLADARGRIDAIVNGKEPVGRVIAQLSAADQVALLGEVNKAIGGMPASVEEKSAKFLNVNHAALRAVKGKGNAAQLLAEVFATVPPEALTVINERFASDLLNRSADPKATYTDEQFTKIAVDLMKVVNARTAETDNGSARSAFAILMLVRASNGAPADLADKLVETLSDADARELAKNEWIPSALGKDGREQGYEPILASADAGRRPDFQYALVIAGPQFLDSILEDIVGKNTDQMAFMRTRTPILDAVENPLVHQIPTFEGELFGGDVPAPPPQEPRPGGAAPLPPEPHPYAGQK